MTAAAFAAAADVASQIEETFAQMGLRLGRGHALFEELKDGLAALSQQLSGARIAGASAALEDVAARLERLLEVLRSEGDLLGAIGASADQSAAVLKPLVKYIKMVMIIARNARIEAASLGSGQEGFLDFTQEAFALAKAVQDSIEACTVDQLRLSDAVATALGRQRDFETRYRGRFRSVGADLVSAQSAMRSRQSDGVRLAASAGAGAKRMADAVGIAIVSLQAGDSTRQRLEHVSRALRIADGSDHGLVPAVPDAGSAAATGRLICALQAEHLASAASEFDADLGDIEGSLTKLLSGAADVVAHGRSLSGSDDGSTGSFLTTVKQALAEASSLIAACDESRRSVDDALTVVDAMLGKFRAAIENLSEAVIDIILIGMNAGLKASQLGVRGRAFVVIANELRATADQISGGAVLLKPILDSIERAAGDLKRVSVDNDPALMTELEPTILLAIREIETEGDQIRDLMTRLVQGGSEFEGLMTSAQALLAALRSKSTRLPVVARELETVTGDAEVARGEMAGTERIFDDLYAQYTMTSERDVHLTFLRRVGLAAPSAGETPPAQAEADDVLFF